MADDHELESFIYSFVARGTMVLSEYTKFTGNFATIAAQCLQKLPSTNNNKISYILDHHVFCFLVDNGYVYCVVVKESVRKQLSFAFLERVREDFKERYGGGKADTSAAKSLDREFGPKMKEHMQYIVEHADEIEKLSNLKAQVSEVQGIMRDNIGKALDRGVVLNVLNEKADTLQESAKEFEIVGAQIKRKMWYQNMKVKLLILGILLLIIVGIWLSVCSGFDCSN